MIKTVILISGVTLFGPGTGGLNVHNPIDSFSVQISHLELSIGDDGMKADIRKNSESGLKLALHSEKIIEVRF